MTLHTAGTIINLVNMSVYMCEFLCALICAWLNRRRSSTVLVPVGTRLESCRHGAEVTSPVAVQQFKTILEALKPVIWKHFSICTSLN